MNVPDGVPDNMTVVVRVGGDSRVEDWSGTVLASGFPSFDAARTWAWQKATE